MYIYYYFFFIFIVEQQIKTVQTKVKSEGILKNASAVIQENEFNTKKKNALIEQITKYEKEIEEQYSSEGKMSEKKETQLKEIESLNIKLKGIKNELNDIKEKLSKVNEKVSFRQETRERFQNMIEDIDDKILNMKYDDIDIIKESKYLLKMLKFVFNMYENMSIHILCGYCYENLYNCRFIWSCGHIICRKCILELVNVEYCSICNPELDEDEIKKKEEEDEDDDDYKFHCPQCNFCVKAIHRPMVELEEISSIFSSKKSELSELKKMMINESSKMLKHLKTGIKNSSKLKR